MFVHAVRGPPPSGSTPAVVVMNTFDAVSDISPLPVFRVQGDVGRRAAAGRRISGDLRQVRAGRAAEEEIATHARINDLGIVRAAAAAAIGHSRHTRGPADAQLRYVLALVGVSIEVHVAKGQAAGVNEIDHVGVDVQAGHRRVAPDQAAEPQALLTKENPSDERAPDEIGEVVAHREVLADRAKAHGVNVTAVTVLAGDLAPNRIIGILLLGGAGILGAADDRGGDSVQRDRVELSRLEVAVHGAPVMRGEEHNHGRRHFRDAAIADLDDVAVGVESHVARIGVRVPNQPSVSEARGLLTIDVQLLSDASPRNMLATNGEPPARSPAM